MTVIKPDFSKKGNTFTTIATFQYSTEAKIVKGRLEHEGIDVFISDDLTIDTDPMVSYAIGGVKLKVKTEDKDKAVSILKSINKYSLDDEGNQISCPNCKSVEVDYFTNITDFKSLISFLVGILLGVLPFYTRYSYRCENCKTKFNIK